MSTGENQYAALWDRLHRGYDTGLCPEDSFLDGYRQTVDRARLPVLDLACGSGANAAWLVRHGKQVVACDYSAEALRQVKRNVPEAETLCFDMTRPFPLGDGCAGLAVCDMGLHFFSERDTLFILGELRRVLAPGGRVILRVNALEDLDPGQIVETLEPRFYHTREGLDMRYFDAGDIERFFAGWAVLSARREQMRRYAAPREVWAVLLENQAKEDG